MLTGGNTHAMKACGCFNIALKPFDPRTTITCHVDRLIVAVGAIFRVMPQNLQIPWVHRWLAATKGKVKGIKVSLASLALDFI